LLLLAGIVLTVYALAQAWNGSLAARAAPRAEASAVARDSRILAEGRLSAYPGSQVVVGTEFAGTLSQVFVQEKDRVQRGQVLAEIRANERRAELAEIRGQMAEARADLTFYTAEADRMQQLFDGRSVPRNALDRAVRDRDAARARLDRSMAAAHRLEAVLEKARIVAPIDGVVLLRHAEPGETVQEGTPLFTLADLSKLRVEAEVDEFDIAGLAVGSTAVISAEGFNKTWKGTIEQIPDSVGPRKLKPQDPGKPADTRVLLVKVALAEPVPLKLGQRVEVSLNPK
jgi:RND family efflux transporter MFP subunit